MMRALAAEAEQTLLALLTVAPARAPELNRVLGVIRGLGQAG
jgi:hypothetical protein